MSDCRTGCPTPGSHPSWGACARASRIQIGDVAGRMNNLAWDHELDAYEGAVRQGIEPRNTTLRETKAAIEFADRTGLGDPWGAVA